MVHMESQKSSGDHSLGVIFNKETHGDLRFDSFGRSDTVLNQTTRTTWHPPVLWASHSRSVQAAFGGSSKLGCFFIFGHSGSYQ